MRKENKYGQNGKFDDWKIEDGARDIKNAEKIKQDKALMPYVKKCLEMDAKAMNNAVKSIQGLRDVHEEKYGAK